MSDMPCRIKPLPANRFPANAIVVKGNRLDGYDDASIGPIRESLLETLRRRELALLLASRAPMAARHAAERAFFEAAFDAACLEVANAMRGPKAKRCTNPDAAREKMSKEGHAVLMALGWTARADELIARHDAERKAIESRVRELAAELRPRPGFLRVRLSDVWVMTYSTQGIGARSYARARADADADRFHAVGVEAEVTFRPTAFKAEREAGARLGRAFGYVDTSGAFEVHVLVASELDAEIVRRAPGLTLREHVRMCWKRGVNPRVYMPFLPHGYEEREGLDFFGNDLRAKGFDAR